MPRRPNPDGSFIGALTAVMADRAAHWTADDVERRMEFSLRCAYAHGTAAIRTHLDSAPPQHMMVAPQAMHAVGVFLAYERGAMLYHSDQAAPTTSSCCRRPTN